MRLKTLFKNNLSTIIIVFLMVCDLSYAGYINFMDKRYPLVVSASDLDLGTVQEVVSANLATEPNPNLPQSSVISASSNIPVLMYHHIKANTNLKNSIEQGLSVPPEQFEQQMTALSQAGYSTVLLKNLFQADQSKKIVLTFDDAYKNVIENAYPTMSKLGFTATVFVISGYVGNDGYMTWDDLKVLRDAGWEIGSHSRSHPDLAKLDDNVATEEVVGSKQTIETNMGLIVESFCYPAGRFDEFVQQAVADAGYKYATTTKHGYRNEAGQALTLKRIRISGNDSVNQFRNKAIR